MEVMQVIILMEVMLNGKSLFQTIPMYSIIFLVFVFFLTSCGSGNNPNINQQKPISLSGSIYQSGNTSSVQPIDDTIAPPVMLEFSCSRETEELFHKESFSYSWLVDIDNDTSSQKDWSIIRMLADKDCSSPGGIKLDEYDAKICPYYVSGDIDFIQKNFPDVRSDDLLLMKSILEWKNYCPSQTDTCSAYIWLVNGIKENSYNFPNTLGSPKINFFVYKKLFPQKYNTELKALLIKTCEENQK